MDTPLLHDLGLSEGFATTGHGMAFRDSIKSIEVMNRKIYFEK
jgi:hypothetical protein